MLYFYPRKLGSMLTESFNSHLKLFFCCCLFICLMQMLCAFVLCLNAMMRRHIPLSKQWRSEVESNWKMKNPFCRTMDLMTISLQELNIPFGFSHSGSVPVETFFNPNCSGYKKTFHYSFLSMWLLFSSTRRLSSLRFGGVIKSALLQEQKG